MENNQVEATIQHILSEDPSEMTTLRQLGFLEEVKNEYASTEESEELHVEEDAEYLNDIDNETLEEMTSTYEEIYAALKQEGCEDLAESLYAALNGDE